MTWAMEHCDDNIMEHCDDTGMEHFNDTATTEIYTLSLHDALPILEHCDDKCHLEF